MPMSFEPRTPLPTPLPPPAPPSSPLRDRLVSLTESLYSPASPPSDASIVSSSLTPVETALLTLRVLMVFYVSASLLLLSLPFYLLSPLSPSFYAESVLPLFRHLWFVSLLTILPPLPPVLLCLPPGGLPSDVVLTPNHQLDIDFLLIWLAVGLSSNAWFGDVRIVLKESVANIPILGTGVKMFGFLPVTRNASQDLPNIQGWSKEGRRIIFPEGTTLNSQDLDSCRQFSQGKDRLEWFKGQNNVLTPRVKGLKALVGNKPSATNVVDVTVIYGNYKGECPTYDMGYDRETEVLPSFKKVLSGLETGFAGLDSALHQLNEMTAGGALEPKSKFSSSTSKTMALVKFRANDKKKADVGKWITKTWQEKSEFISKHKDGSWVDSDSSEGSLSDGGGDWMKQSPARLRQPLLILGLCWAPGFCFFSYIISFFLGGWVLLLMAGLKKISNGPTQNRHLVKHE
ncbi:hypothetical protein TrCOL_g3693 [Triparma columacea]|uniref:Phospholipid/glycerol acyltransferase domain-containing protein n=1 Tax=Triparma columacea TaxID=722753 RepID=A0A9W7G8D7_9STRA|nr:hypothetical protein TrCOL_g3693 [Triparma columacea]